MGQSTSTMYGGPRKRESWNGPNVAVKCVKKKYAYGVGHLLRKNMRGGRSLNKYSVGWAKKEMRGGWLQKRGKSGRR